MRWHTKFSYLNRGDISPQNNTGAIMKKEISAQSLTRIRSTGRWPEIHRGRCSQRMDVGLSTMTRWVKQLRDERQEKHQKPPPLPRNKLKSVSSEKATTYWNGKWNIKKATALLCQTPWTVFDNRETQGALSCGTLCHVFGVHRSSYKYWKNRLKNQTADGLYYAARYLNCMAQPRLCRSKKHRHNGNPERLPMGRWLAGRLMKELGLVSCQRRLTGISVAVMSTLLSRIILATVRRNGTKSGVVRWCDL